MNRRDFLRKTAATGLMVATPGAVAGGLRLTPPLEYWKLE
jgi:hypothetical protein